MSEPEILRLRVKNITPTIIGGYKATTYSSKLRIAEGFRSQELKGIWRWWFRALLAGSIWDRLGKIDKEGIKNVRKKTELLLGSTKSSSKFILQVFGTACEPVFPSKKDLPPRLNILRLTRDRDKLRYYDDGSLNYEIVLLERPYSNLGGNDVRVSVGSLITALIFQGIGAITRRGFGSLEVVNYEFKRFGEDFQHYSSFLNKLKEVTSETQAEKLLRDFIKDVHEDFTEFLELKNLIGETSKEGNPPFSVVSTDDRIFKLRVKEVSATCSMDLLNKLGNAVMKVQWKRLIYKSLKEPDGRFHSWILGLPRGSQTEKHGYSIGEKGFELGRRPSAISLRALKKIENKWLCLIYGFLSQDWPYDRLYHTSGRDRRKRPIKQFDVQTSNKLKPFSLECVFETAFDMVVRCLE